MNEIYRVGIALPSDKYGRLPMWIRGTSNVMAGGRVISGIPFHIPTMTLLVFWKPNECEN